jgi:lysozyme family protein
MADRLPICLPYTLAQECPYPNDWPNPHNFSNDPHDPGGATMCGIIQSEYDIYRQANGLPLQPVMNISLAEGTTIYRNSYWIPRCPTLAPGIDLSFFDMCVNAGPFGATKVLQDALQCGVDGQWGPITQNAVDGITSSQVFINAFAAARKNYYRQLNGFPYFGNGWFNRVDSICASSLAMAANSSVRFLANQPQSDYTTGTNAAIPVAILDLKNVVPELFWDQITYAVVAPIVGDIVKAAVDAIKANPQPTLPKGP